jgi:mannose-6-phosphate isomerase-like protein (cupin superfamily)
MLGTQIKPYVFTDEEGPAFWSVGVLARLKATGAQTEERFDLVEEWCPPGYATPLHIHHAEHEAFFVLEGELTIFCGNERIHARPGTYVFGPREIPHGFRVVGTEPARVLILAAPSGFAQFLVEAGEPAKDLTSLPDTPLDLERIAAVGARHQIEILGPLPD